MNVNWGAIFGGVFMLIAVYLIFAGRDTRGKLPKLVTTGGGAAVDLIRVLQGREAASGRVGLAPGPTAMLS